MEGTRSAQVGILAQARQVPRTRLLAALEAAYPVSFHDAGVGDWRALDGLVVLGAGDLPDGLPGDLPVLRAVGEERRQDSPHALELADEGTLARSLRSAHLSDAWSAPLDSAFAGALSLVLAASNQGPAWGVSAERARTSLVGVAPAELGPGEALRERLTPGRCLALLALTHFIRRLLEDPRLDEPSLQAAFVLDDPNLHWPSYGHVGYEQLSRHACEHGYHVAVAMVPLDGWLAHPRAVRIFKRAPEQLSICVHGNDHDGPELGRVSSEQEGTALARQALERARAFQQRTGIAIDRVMVPPHEQLSLQAAKGLLHAGYDAVCVSRPYPWIAPENGQSPLVAPAERGALSGWGSREIVIGGLPVLLRAGFNHSRDDLALRAYLGQPLILYGHHDVLEHGPDVFAEAAAAINALGPVRWCSLDEIARGGVQTELSGERLDATSPARPARIRPRPVPLLRRLASEGRDRLHALRSAGSTHGWGSN
jgi:hypothetical protein